MLTCFGTFCTAYAAYFTVFLCHRPLVLGATHDGIFFLFWHHFYKTFRTSLNTFTAAFASILYYPCNAPCYGNCIKSTCLYAASMSQTSVGTSFMPVKKLCCSSTIVYSMVYILFIAYTASSVA